MESYEVEIKIFGKTFKSVIQADSQMEAKSKAQLWILKQAEITSKTAKVEFKGSDWVDNFLKGFGK